MQNIQNISWASRVYSSLKSWFLVKKNCMLSLLSLHTSAQSFPTKIGVAINYFVFSFIECKLNLNSFTETIVNASLFRKKNLL